MNMYVPLSQMTAIELIIASVMYQIISARNSNPLIQLKQDSLVGANKFTEDNYKMDWHDAMNLIMYTYKTDKYAIKKEDINMYDVYSFIIPDMINYKDKHTEIKDGKIIKGILNGGILQKLILNIWDKYGSLTAKTFIDNLQRLVTKWLMDAGFTLGLYDALPPIELETKGKEFMEKQKLEIDLMLTTQENNPELLQADIFENNVKNKLNKRDFMGNMTMETLNIKNNFYRMISSKAKGEWINLGQIALGSTQDMLKGERLPKQVNGRTTVHFFQNDDRADARGYIANSFSKGLKAHEAWFHHSTGREGLINTAIKTGDTGYMQRKLIKGMEDAMVAYDGTVRTSTNVILQILYGGNQMDQSMQKAVKLSVLNMGNSEIKNNLVFTAEELSTFKEDKKLNDSYYEDIRAMRNKMREYQMIASAEYLVIKDIFFQPILYSRIIDDIKDIETDTNTKLEQKYILDEINRILSHEVTPLMTLANKEKNPCKYQDEKICKFLFKLMLYEYLSPKRCIVEYKFNKEKFDKVIEEIIFNYNRAFINPGEMVGILTAQSMGEPLSQMTLSSFHQTGSGGEGRQGIPRLKEILSFSKNISNPTTYIYLKDEYKQDKTYAKKISSYLKFTILKDITKKIDIVYDPLYESSDSYTQKDTVDTKNVFYINKSSLDKLPWLFRIYLSREALIEYDINMLDIKASFINFWLKNVMDNVTTKNKLIKDLIPKILNVCILTNNNNSDTPIVHIRFDLKSIDNRTLNDIAELLLNKYNLKGSKYIKTIDDIKQHKCFTFDNDDEKIEPVSEYIIVANGIDMQRLINMKVINMYKSTSTDILTVYKNYGIEAVRSLIIKEITRIFESGGASISIHHITLMADIMTNTGNITSIDRHGINKLDTDPFSRASFEMPLEQFIKAAIFNEMDKMRSVSSQVMLGKSMKGGTGLCELILDEEILASIEYNNNISGYISHPIQLAQDDLMADIMSKTIGSMSI